MSSKQELDDVQPSCDSDVSIRVSNLGKIFHIYDRPENRLKQSVLSPLRRLLGLKSKNYYREYPALKNVSFEVKKGETIGVIGRNGAGKSTLLQIICGTLAPSSGDVEVSGRVAALLELGSGFNPEFTGRENVYLNASILGLSKDETDACFDDIAAFADIGEFIERPVKTYSSGMLVRLAFAVQAQIEPSILIVDEALAVGDAKFQARCFERLKQLKEGGTTILLVTHSTEQIATHCSRALLLDKGSVREAGDPRHVINCYLDLLFGKNRKQIDELKPDVEQNINERPHSEQLSLDADVYSTRPGYNAFEYRWGDGAARITDFYLASQGEAYPSALSTGSSVTLEVAVKFLETLRRPIFGITIKTKEGVEVYGTNTELLDIEQFKSKGLAGEAVIIKVGFICRLAPGDYFISLGVASSQGEDITPHDRRYDSIYLPIRPDKRFFGLVDTDVDIRL